ncbi:MAG: D-amino-acid dehydrogenase [Ilumatobacteraceae bacterium]|nr:D-amino-acid dehydrogenase [Ilumatobacteraceae bacterium]
MTKSVVIVGGGLVGLSSALFLTEAGAEVTIIDSGALGSGAARGNAGFMCTAIVEPLPAPGAIGNALRSLRDPTRALRILPKAIPKMAPWLLSFARNCTASRYQSGRAALATFNRNSAEVVERLVHQGAAVTMSRELLVPYHDVAKAQHHFDALQPMVEFGARIPDRVVDGDELRRLAPAITDHIRAGLVMPGDRSIDPRRYVDSIIAILKARDVRIMEHTTVSQVMSSGDRVQALQVSGGTVDGDEYVLTAGAGSRLLAKQFDLRLAVIPGQGYNVGLPTSPGLQQPVIFEEVHAVATPFEDRIRLGGTMEFGGDHPPFDPRRIEAIIESMRKFLDLDWDNRFDTWAGSRPMSADGLPFMGRPKRWRNVVVGAGHGMFGLTLAAPSGVAISELIMTGRTSSDITAFDPDRSALRR